jgi:signal transduction histidine kinase
MRNKPTAGSKQVALKRAAARFETERTQLRRLVAHLQGLREAECVRISDAVNDELLSRLVCTSLGIDELRRHSHKGSRTSRLAWAGVAQRLKEAIQIAACLRAQLRPALLDHCGLEVAMGWAAAEWTKRHGVCCEVAGTTDLSRVTPRIALELFRLFEDGLRSLSENREPAGISIEISSSPTAHCLTLHTGAVAVNDRHKLLRSPTFLAVRERARCLGGNLVVRDTPQAGISLAITVPAGS